MYPSRPLHGKGAVLMAMYAREHLPPEHVVLSTQFVRHFHGSETLVGLRCESEQQLTSSPEQQRRQRHAHPDWSLRRSCI